MDSIDNLIKKFRGKGYKVTPQRIAIFKELEGNHDHPSVEGLYKTLASDYPTMSLTTVYKTLETLRDMGEVLELNLSRDRVHYDPETRPHHHAICGECGKIIDVFHDAEELLQSVSAFRGSFKPCSYSIIFNGNCLKCKKGN